MTEWLTTAVFCAGLVASGWFWAEALTPVRPPLAARAGLGFLIGAALVTLAMLGLGLADLPITRLGVVACAAAVAVGGRVALMRLPSQPGEARIHGDHLGAIPLGVVSVTVLSVTAAVAVGSGPVTQIDFIRAWGLKALVVFTQHNLDFRLVARHWQFYPLEVSNAHAALYLLLGHADERVIRLSLAMFGLSLAVAMWWLCRLMLPPTAAALAVALAVTTPMFASSLASGLADPVVASYITIAALGAFLWVRDSNTRWAALSGLTAGAAAWSKLEGAPTTLVILAGALLVARHDRVRGAAIWLGWFCLFTVPWIAYQRLHDIHISHAHFSGLFLHPRWIALHVGERLGNPDQWGIFWIASAVVIGATVTAWWPSQWRSLAAITLPNIVLTAGAYVIHSRNSPAVYHATASRLYLHIAPSVAVMVAAATHAAWTQASRSEAAARGEPP